MITSIIFQLLLPALFIFVLLMANFKGKKDWVIHSLLFTILISWLFFSDRWDFTSYYLRFLWPLLLIIALYISWRKIRFKSPVKAYTIKDKTTFALLGLVTLVFASFHIPVLFGYSTDQKAIELEFPLQDGTYYISQGGSSKAINHHYDHPKQRYALDVTQLNKYGMRSSGVSAESLDSSVIYGNKLLSPCSGEVINSRSNSPDLIPPKADPDKPAGNYVQIKCEPEEVDVFIAHMQEGSVAVATGDDIKTGDPIGLVGNSGNTTGPHLHIHAQKNKEGIPMKFDDRFLVRNDLVWK